MGTEDVNALTRRAANGNWLSIRWAELLDHITLQEAGIRRKEPVIYLPHGFHISLPELEQAELCQIQFVAAWLAQPKLAEDALQLQMDDSTWYAVDQLIHDVLTNTGCS